ncbi:hypothetical protein [Larkinella harenae]
MNLSPLSAYASRHPRTAAGIIILSEFTNAAIGLILGSTLLANQPAWYLTFLLAALLVFRILYSRYSALRLIDLAAGARFRFQKNRYALFFFINVLIYSIAGGISGRAVIHPEPSVSVSSGEFRTYASEKDSTTTRSTRDSLEKNTAKGKKQERSRSGIKIGYVLLFIASAFLSLLASGFACRLACTNQGFAAVLVILLGMGVLAGGLYFLGRVFDKEMKPYKTMTREERKREGRRFWRTLLGTVIGLGIFALIGFIL